jgi:predicted metal-dependent peptidase
MSQEFNMIFVENCIVEGLRRGDFSSCLLCNINRKEEKELPAPAGVSLDFDELNYNMAFNFEFMDMLYKKIKQNERNGEETFYNLTKETFLKIILHHELMHLANNHLKSSKEYIEKYSMQALNYAMDLAVNSLLKDYYTSTKFEYLELLMPGRNPFETFPHHLSYVQYLKLMEKENKLQNMPSLNGTNHSFLEDIDKYMENPNFDNITIENAVEIANAKLSQSAKKTFQEYVSRKNAGNITGINAFFQDWIINKVNINWGNLIMSETSTNLTDFKKHYFSFARPSRRQYNGVVKKGRKYKPLPSIYVIMDTSGSVSKTDYEKFFSVLNSLERKYKNVQIMQYDCDKKTQFKALREYLKGKTFAVEGGGGTDMKKAVEDLVKIREDIAQVIILTDGYTPAHTDKDVPKGIKLLWVITSEGADTESFAGRKILIQ